MTTPDRDLVAELRQRVRAARDGLGINSERLWEALNDLDAELANVVDGPSTEPDPVAVASALLGFRADIAQDEWCVFAGDDPATTPARVVGLSRWSRAQTLRDRIDARDFRPGSDLDDVFGQSTAPVRIARRASWSSLHRTPWQVVDTEGGEPRA